MIGENIRKLRHTQGLTQPEFAERIGVSRNSLSRYENGSSPISTDIIDRICQAFQVSYREIVGEEKMINPLEEYQLSSKIDLFKERAASILARLYHFQDKHAIAFDDEKNPWVLLGDDLSMILQDKIYTIQSIEELERYQGYLDGIERMLDLAEQQKGRRKIKTVIGTKQ